MNEERNRAISIFKEIKELIPGYFEGKIPSNKKCDLKKIGSLTDELRSEGYLFYSSEVELDELISIAYELTNRVKLANYDPEATFFVIDNILDSIWHQKKSEDSSDSNKRNLASLAINILGFNIGKYWVDELAPSASNFNHCVYFIFMLEDRFRTENEEFESVFNYLNPFIKKYGENHHLSQRWLNRMNSIREKNKNAM